MMATRLVFFYFIQSVPIQDFLIFFQVLSYSIKNGRIYHNQSIFGGHRIINLNKLAQILPIFLLPYSQYCYMASPTKFVRYESEDTLTVQKTSINTTFSIIPAPKITRQCRICLQDEHESQNKDYITPCKCTGSVQHIHAQCLRKWIQSTLKTKTKPEYEKIQKEGIQCEMCKYLIKFQMDSKYACVNCDQLGHEITKKYLLFLVVFLLFLIATGGFCFALYSVILNSHQFQDQTGVKFESILSICGAIILFLFASLALYTLISQFLLYTVFIVGKIRSLNPSFSSLSKSRNQVSPIEDISEQNIEIGNIRD